MTEFLGLERINRTNREISLVRVPRFNLHPPRPRRTVYKFIKTAATPPNNIAGPAAAVFIAIAPPLCVLEVCPGAAFVGMVAVGAGTPLVNRALETLDAPENAGAPAVAPAEGAAVVLLGLSTLAIDQCRRGL